MDSLVDLPDESKFDVELELLESDLGMGMGWGSEWGVGWAAVWLSSSLWKLFSLVVTDVLLCLLAEEVRAFFFTASAKQM